MKKLYILVAFGLISNKALAERSPMGDEIYKRAQQLLEISKRVESAAKESDFAKVSDALDAVESVASSLNKLALVAVAWETQDRLKATLLENAEKERKASRLVAPVREKSPEIMITDLKPIIFEPIVSR